MLQGTGLRPRVLKEASALVLFFFLAKGLDVGGSASLSLSALRVGFGIVVWLRVPWQFRR